jgi:hypothetical protein
MSGFTADWRTDGAMGTAVTVDRVRCVPVLCAGLYSSGSTWLFNAVAGLLRSSVGTSDVRLVQFFADSLDDFPELEALPDYLVVKSHATAPTMRLLWRIAQGPLLITVRDPRDAVASLITRFGFSFDLALQLVVSAGECMVDLQSSGTALILRYEDRFFERQETMQEIARWLGISISSAVAGQIFASLSREAVAAKIEHLTEQGVFGPNPTPDRFDPETHWHPNHLGSGQSGQYLDVISTRNQAKIILNTRRFCEAFGYYLELPPKFSSSLFEKERAYLMGEPILFGKAHETAKFLTEGWSLPGGDFVWSLDQRSQITLDVGDLPVSPDQYCLRLTLLPFTKGALPSQRISIFLNGELLLEDRLASLTELELAVPRSVLGAQQPAIITLVHPDAARPSDYEPENIDSRMISIGVLALEISPAEPA